MLEILSSHRKFVIFFLELKCHVPATFSKKMKAKKTTFELKNRPEESFKVGSPIEKGQTRPRYRIAMPPKGWRKDSQGNYPQQSFIKEQEKLTIDDLLFPKSTVLNLAKEVQMENDPNKKLIISKDASLALQRSASVFVNHLLMFAREWAKDHDRKSCNVDDILAALEQTGHPGLKPIVQARVNEYQQMIAARKQAKLQQMPNQLEKTEEQETNNDSIVEGEEENQVNKKQKVDIAVDASPELAAPAQPTEDVNMLTTDVPIPEQPQQPSV